MSRAAVHEHIMNVECEVINIDYVEWQSRDLSRSKAFFQNAFGWTFTDYGPGYAAFEQGLDGGIEAADSENPAPPLIILRTDDLDAARDAVVSAGGEIVTDIFAFPGGRRFHFREPGGSVLAVWADAAPDS